MTSLIRLVLFEFALIRMLFFRVVFERLINTMMAAFGGFIAVYASSFWATDAGDFAANAQSASSVQSMILFAFLYAETIMANWQYTTNKTGRMEVIFNSTQSPLLIVLVKSFASACVTFLTLIFLYILPLAWFGLLGVLNLSFFLAALATLLVCCAIMTFNAFFEFRVKQVKALTSMLNLVLPYLATRFALDAPDGLGFIPYFNGVKFISLEGQYDVSNVAWLFLTASVTAAVFLLWSQFFVRRIRTTASVYLE
jgi:hypothetical protein